MTHSDLIISDNRDAIHDPGVLVPIPTRPVPFLTERGPNGKLVYRSNPVSWLVDAFHCIPFLNFNGSGSQATQDAAAAVAASPGATPNTLPVGVQANPFASLFGLVPASSPAPTSNPHQAGSYGNPGTTASIDPPHVPAAAAAAAARPKSRQQQIIESSPLYGLFNPRASSREDRQQIRQAQQAIGLQPYPTLANTLPGGG